jgi:hypothetical protein
MGWNGLSSPGRFGVLSALLAVALLGGAVSTARSQVTVQASNSYISATLGVSGTLNNVNLAGRTGLLDNVIPGDLMTMIVTPTKQSYITVRIDGGPPTPGIDADTQTSPGWDLIFGDVGSNALNGSPTGQKTNQSAWIQQPAAVGNVITAKWATLPGGNTTFPIPPIEVDLKITLIHDMACYEFTIINKDVRPHTIGIRFAEELAKPAIGGPDGPLYTPNLGGITHEVDLMGSSVPSYWRGFYSNGATNGAVLFSNTAGSVVTRPDRVTFGSPLDVTGSLWTFTADPTVSFVTGVGDAASGVYFNPRTFNAGEKKVITTYYGRNHSTLDFDRPFAAGVDAPFSVKFDPTKPVGQQLTPNPMTITGFVFNTNQNFSLTNVTATISLPNGLALDTGETASKTIGDVSANNEGSATWSVVPTGAASGVQTIAVSFASGPGSLGKVITRTIELPFLPTKTFSGGIQMVSFPFTFGDPTPSVALGLSPIDFDLLRWNATQGFYEPVTRILPGEGYWLRLGTGRTISLVDATPITVTTSPFEIKLRQGWEQIGNPFLYRVKWADVQVINTDVSDPDALRPLSIDEATQRGWILSTIYRYDPIAGEYVFDQDLSTDLIPFEGYWVRALRSNLSLLIPPTSGRAAKSNGSSKVGAATPGGWSLRLALKGEKTQDTYNFIGLSSSANDGVDRFDVEKPPAVQSAVRFAINRPNWGRRAGAYAADVQAMGGRKQWDVVVTSPAPNENVTLSWPEISRLPKGYELTITDKATGVRTIMRQTTSIRINTGTAASRSYTITAEPRSSANALMLRVKVDGRAPGLAKVSVSSSVNATFSVRVFGQSGQSIRQVTGGRAATPDTDTTVVWDGKDTRGVSVPSGTYTIEVKGVTTDGQTAKQIVPVVIVR